VYRDLNETGSARTLQAPVAAKAARAESLWGSWKKPLLRQSDEPRSTNHMPRRARPVARRVWIRFFVSIIPSLDGAWLGSFYVITDVIDKELYSNAPCNWHGAARRVIGGARLFGSPQKRFFHDPQRDSARAAVAATRRLQSTCQASLVQPVYT
jgi:hypothetical protein